MGEVHTVEQGECLSSIAVCCGIPWKKIYNHAKNSDFRRKRPDPNVIFAGDQIYIPDLELRTEDAVTDQNHTFVISTPSAKISIIVQDEIGRPLASMKYILKITGGSGKDISYKGSTTGEGLIEREIPPDATDGELTVLGCGAGYTWALALGHLDPLDEISGAQHRLHNLGYDTNSATPGVLDDVTRDALRAFQYDVGLTVNGNLDDNTKNKLKEQHD